MAETLSAAQSEISLGQIASPEQNRHNSLVQNPFQRTLARWKENFINFNLEGCFSTCSVLEVKGKL
jgi:hypothetical protein